jgi:hypothetical protein
MRASRASVGSRSSGEVAQQHVSARSNQRFVNSLLCLNLFSAERHSYIHICAFNVRLERRAASSASTLERDVRVQLPAPSLHERGRDSSRSHGFHLGRSCGFVMQLR